MSFTDVARAALEAYITAKRTCINCKQDCQQWELDLGYHLGVRGLILKESCPAGDKTKPKDHQTKE